MTQYPEHEKLQKIIDQSQTVGEFLDWLSDSGFTICELDGLWKSQYCPVGKTVEMWLAEYFEIDLTKIDAEKRQMLEEIRKESEK